MCLRGSGNRLPSWYSNLSHRVFNLLTVKMTDSNGWEDLNLRFKKPPFPTVPVVCPVHILKDCSAWRMLCSPAHIHHSWAVKISLSCFSCQILKVLFQMRCYKWCQNECSVCFMWQGMRDGSLFQILWNLAVQRELFFYASVSLSVLCCLHFSCCLLLSQVSKEKLSTAKVSTPMVPYTGQN